MDDVETATERFGVNQLDGRQFVLAQLATDSQLRLEGEAEATLDHSFCRLDRVHFQSNIGNQAGRAKQAMSEGPVARAALVKNQWPACDSLQRSAAGMLWPAARVSNQQERVVTQADGLDLGMLQRAGEDNLCFFVQDHIQDFF